MYLLSFSRTFLKKEFLFWEYKYYFEIINNGWYVLESSGVEKGYKY